MRDPDTCASFLSLLQGPHPTQFEGCILSVAHESLFTEGGERIKTQAGFKILRVYLSRWQKNPSFPITHSRPPDLLNTKSTFCFQMYWSRVRTLELISPLPTHLLGRQKKVVPPTEEPILLSALNIYILWILYYDSHRKFVAWWLYYAPPT